MWPHYHCQGGREGITLLRQWRIPGRPPYVNRRSKAMLALYFEICHVALSSAGLNAVEVWLSGVFKPCLLSPQKAKPDLLP